MKFEIEVSDEDWRQMLKNRYGHGDVITKDYMLDIVHDIIDQYSSACKDMLCYDCMEEWKA